MWRKIRNFAIQAISSENDRKIGRKYNGNIAGDFFKGKLHGSCKRFGRLQMLHWSFLYNYYALNKYEQAD